METQEEIVEQTPEEAIADKIFGKEEDTPEYEAADEVVEDDEPEELEAAEDAPEEPGYVEVEIDGEVLQVPEKYKDYLMRHADYTQKTQAVAQDRKQVEIAQTAIQQERRQYEFLSSVQEELNQAYLLDNQVKQYRDYMKSNIDSLSGQDLEKLRFHIDELNSQKQALTDSLQTKYGDFQKAQEQSHKELLDKSTETLKGKIPNWSQETQQKVRSFAIESGFTDQEVDAVYDPRMVEVLWKAQQYDTLKKGATTAVKKVAEAPQIRPKSRNPMPDDVKRKLNLRKKLNSTRSAEDKAGLIRENIADRLGL